MKATIFDIQRDSYVDGPGIRTTVFFKGCNLRCRWCHNPESQDPEKQFLFYREKCTGCGRCRGACHMQVDPVRDPDSAECIRCGACVDICPVNALSFINTMTAGKKQKEKQTLQSLAKS